ncbi:MAG: NADP-dependent malic enzyme [Patescibacteria group bacterium]|nr:NADP-dependent malic enzyme [Patescibacteria group bacterium]
MKKNYAKLSLALHKKLHGKISISTKTKIDDREDLAVVYTPGVGAVSSAIAKDERLADVMTWRKNAVAIVSDGSAVLGLGNIGAAAALPVMEGKSAIFKRFTNIDAVPLVLATQDTDEIVRIVQALEPSFGAIQLEDISAPRCFEIEERLSKSLKIPVMHDDQHGTAIVVLGGILNAMKVTKRNIKASVKIVVNGAGAAGVAIAKLLLAAGFKHVVVCDRKGAIYAGRPGMNPSKVALASITNPEKKSGSLDSVIQGADIFVGVSGPGLLTADMVKSMAPKSIVFGLANPIPEIMPDAAKAAGAAIVASGRSDMPNQLNNALVYPGLFRGMLDKGIKRVDDRIKLRAALALSGFVKKPTAEKIIPSIFDKGLHQAIARSVK